MFLARHRIWMRLYHQRKFWDNYFKSRSSWAARRLEFHEHVWLHGAVPISLASIQWTDKDEASKTFERSGDQAVLSSFVGGLRFRRKQLDSLIAYGDCIFTLLISASKHGFNIHWCLWMLRVSHFQPSPTINYIPVSCARCPLVKLVTREDFESIKLCICEVCSLQLAKGAQCKHGSWWRCQRQEASLGQKCCGLPIYDSLITLIELSNIIYFILRYCAKWWEFLCARTHSWGTSNDWRARESETKSEKLH